VSRYQKKHSPTHTYLISFHLNLVCCDWSQPQQTGTCDQIRVAATNHNALGSDEIRSVVDMRSDQGRRKVKQSGVDSMDGVWGRVSPPKSEGRVWDTI